MSAHSIKAVLPFFLLLPACDQPRPTTEAPPAARPASSVTAQLAQTQPDTTHIATPQPTGPVWHDSNGRTYPLPDSIGGQPVSFYLSNPKVSPLAKALYTSRFRPSDSVGDSTTQLLALVTTDDKTIRPFYRWALNFTIQISDGALGEYPGVPALAYATKFPQEFFTYMDKETTGERYKAWVETIAYSGLNDYTGESTPAIEKGIVTRMTTQCRTCNQNTIRRISSFARDITHTGEDYHQ